jgi:hypothetical protein
MQRGENDGKATLSRFYVDLFRFCGIVPIADPEPEPAPLVTNQVAREPAFWTTIRTPKFSFTAPSRPLRILNVRARQHYITQRV